MKKIVVTSDFHLDHVSNGIDRHAELKERALETVTYAVAEKAAYYMFLGDLCDPDRGADVAKSLEVVMEMIIRLDEADIRSVWLAGNHDVIEDGSGRTVLTPLREVAHVVEKPELVSIPHVGWCAFLPFTSAANPYFPIKVVDEWRALRPGGVLLAAGHLSVPGTVPGEEVHEMRRGRDVTLPVERLTGWADYLFNGHVHKQQCAGGVHIPGSLAQLTFGEGANDPGFLVLEVNGAL